MTDPKLPSYSGNWIIEEHDRQEALERKERETEDCGCPRGHCGCDDGWDRRE